MATNRTRICRAMLEPEFLDTIIDRFVREEAALGPDSRPLPPFDNRLLSYLALLKLGRGGTLEQITILLRFPTLFVKFIKSIKTIFTDSCSPPWPALGCKRLSRLSSSRKLKRQKRSCKNILYSYLPFVYT